MAETLGSFGSCIVLKEIYRDDLGRVCRAGTVEGTSIDRTIWLRTFEAEDLRLEPIVASFETARMVAEAVQSANLPQDPLFVDDGGVPAIGCDYTGGQPLNRMLERARDEAFPVAPDNALLIVEKIALAVISGMAVEVGGNPLVHGFLHPGLIFLSNDGEAVVTGFGLGDALLDSLEKPGAIADGHAYLAPEVLAHRSPSKAGDVYSLGAILFHLLTGAALPVAPEDRPAALDAAYQAYDGEPLAPEILELLRRALAEKPGDRGGSAADFRADLDKLVFGGSFSPTTFNLALLMDRLFRAEIDADETDLASERNIDVTPFLSVEPEPVPEAMPEAEPTTSKRNLFIAVGGAVIVISIALVSWLIKNSGPSLPPPEPTPTAAQIAARRQAQEDRLTQMTQEMVQQMMAEREGEIRDELIARQTRIEELQRRLQRSERRAAEDKAAAAKEAETQKKLKLEIEAAEKAQKEQAEALKAELEKPEPVASRATELIKDQTGTGESSAPGEVALGSAATDDQNESAGPQSRVLPPEPTPPSAKQPAVSQKKEVTERSVRVGEYVDPDVVDTAPVVIKSASLMWPRKASHSMRKGVIVVQVTVNATGSVDEARILRADDSDLGIPEAAIEAASSYRFKPGTKDGVAITTDTFITWQYDFTNP